MSEPYQILVLIPEGIEQKRAVQKTHEILGTWGGHFCEETILWLQDIDDEEFEPEELKEVSEENIKQFLDKLSGWPTFGFIEYEMPWFALNVSYKGQVYSNKVNLILLSLSRNTFDNYREASEPFYVELSKVLHENFRAKRTIMDHSITHREDFQWEEEIERLKADQFRGEYSILDLHRV
jgi:hypothetical protein